MISTQSSSSRSFTAWGDFWHMSHLAWCKITAFGKMQAIKGWKCKTQKMHLKTKHVLLEITVTKMFTSNMNKGISEVTTWGKIHKNNWGKKIMSDGQKYRVNVHLTPCFNLFEVKFCCLQHLITNDSEMMWCTVWSRLNNYWELIVWPRAMHFSAR